MRLTILIKRMSILRDITNNLHKSGLLDKEKKKNFFVISLDYTSRLFLLQPLQH